MKNLETNKEIPDADMFEINFIELKKLPKNVGSSMKELWLKFLSAKTEEDLIMVAQQSPIMKKAVSRLERVNADKKLLAYMRSIEKQERDYATGLSNAEERGERRGEKRGIREGMKEGIREGMEKTAMAMIANGEGNNKIRKYTELPLEHIENLRKKVKY